MERLRDHYGIRDLRVLEAIRSVPRHFFVPEAFKGRSYGDHALPIDANQTISQPFIVARMSELLEKQSEEMITPLEKNELDALLRVYQVGNLRKSQGIYEAVQRGLIKTPDDLR